MVENIEIGGENMYIYVLRIRLKFGEIIKIFTHGMGFIWGT